MVKIFYFFYIKIIDNVLLHAFPTPPKKISTPLNFLNTPPPTPKTSQTPPPTKFSQPPPENFSTPQKKSQLTPLNPHALDDQLIRSIKK